ncbi:MAG TPA: hypothetical protein VFL51_02900 [Pseudolabrys sp.]|nr:hypothetical protein [Pseudolabrys sp.]
MRTLLIGSVTLTIAAIVLLGFALRHAPDATAGPEAAGSVDPYTMQSNVDMKKLPEQVIDDLI